MEAGKVTEFIDNLTIQDEMVRYEGNLYYFYGIRFDEKKNLYYTSVDKFRNNINEFEREIYRYIKHLELSKIGLCVTCPYGDRGGYQYSVSAGRN